MISIEEIVVDPDFYQPYKVYRNQGTWQEGEFVKVETILQFCGTITVANTQDVNMLPEGDRIAGLMTFYSTADKPIFVTRNLIDDKGTSDEIEWRGERYRVLQTFPYNDYGYIKAMGTRMDGS